jgi:CRISPR-associated protein Cmr1
MPRTLPSTSPPTLEGLSPPTPWVIAVRTITPMFGGSAATRDVNIEDPVRAPSIRGLLRFFWRCTAGAHHRNAEDLFKEEEEIWGSIEHPGKVAIHVFDTQLPPNYETQFSKLGSNTSAQGPLERTFLHPFNKNKSEGLEEATGIRELDFKLQLTLTGNLTEPQIKSVKMAVRAWLSLGGVGSRTRRGLGALTVLEDQAKWQPKDLEEFTQWFKSSASSDAEEPLFTTLVNARACFGEAAKESQQPKLTPAHQAWRDLGRFWARFRKGHYLPEPDKSQYIPIGPTKWQDHGHLKALKQTDTKIALVKAFLGLPIIHPKAPHTADAFQGEIYADSDVHTGDRMASPIILKPVAFADGSIRPMVLILRTPEPKSVKIKDQKLQLELNTGDPVLQALKAKDALEAVHQAALIQGFTHEVQL